MKSAAFKNRYFYGVNFDYVLAVKYEDNKIEKQYIPIKKNNKLIDDLLSMVDDESCEVIDMYNAFIRNYSECGEFDYCLGHDSLKSYYIDPIGYPCFDKYNYTQQARAYKEKISLAKSEKVRNWYQKDFDIWNYRKKVDYIKKCIPYILACNYHDAIEEYNIEKNYFIYSNETHGRFSYSRKITEDVEVVLKTNFCYGKSSSLIVIVTYKGIPILPYSIWVNYFYAGFNEIIRCTRSYEPNRENWNVCMDFVVWFIEKAIENPENFVKEVMSQEVDDLVKGIEKLFKLTDKEMENELSISCADKIFQEKYYIGIRTARMASQQDVRYYTISPEEAKLVYRMEKITGALHFLESLRKLSDIYNGVDQAIIRIKEINALFYPEIHVAISSVTEYITEQVQTLKPIEKKLTIVRKEFVALDNRLNKRLKKVENDKRMEVEESFVKSNPRYKKLKDELCYLENKVQELKFRIANRENYLHQLEDAQSLVKKYVILKKDYYC